MQADWNLQGKFPLPECLVYTISKNVKWLLDNDCKALCSVFHTSSFILNLKSRNLTSPGFILCNLAENNFIFKCSSAMKGTEAKGESRKTFLWHLRESKTLLLPSFRPILWYKRFFFFFINPGIWTRFYTNFTQHTTFHISQRKREYSPFSSTCLPMIIPSQ